MEGEQISNIFEFLFMSYKPIYFIHGPRKLSQANTFQKNWPRIHEKRIDLKKGEYFVTWIPFFTSLYCDTFKFERARMLNVNTFLWIVSWKCVKIKKCKSPPITSRQSFFPVEIKSAREVFGHFGYFVHGNILYFKPVTFRFFELFFYNHFFSTGTFFSRIKNFVLRTEFFFSSALFKLHGFFFHLFPGIVFFFSQMEFSKKKHGVVDILMYHLIYQGDSFNISYDLELK